MSNLISNIISKNPAISSAQLDGIQFNNIQKKGFNSTVKYVREGNPWSTLDTSTPVQPAVNAVDIDWNEAVIDENTIIKTTGELLSLIKYIKEHSGSNISPVDSERLENIENTISLYQETFNNVLTKQYADSKYQPKGDYQVAGNYETVENHNISLQELETNLTNQVTTAINLASQLDTKYTSLDTQLNTLKTLTQGLNATVNNINNDYASKTYVNERIAEVIDGAPEALDTLNEIAAKLSEDNDTVMALTNEIASKASIDNVYSKEDIDVKISELNNQDATLFEQYNQLDQKIDSIVPGLKGETGDKGPQGDQGAAGETGAVGPQGPQGDQGAAGETGAKGPQGDQGAAGETGAVGPQGPQGAAGETGVKGPQGQQGAAGETGVKGPQGQQGLPGTYEIEILNSYASKEYVSDKISEVIGGAPETLDTLKEIADVINNDHTSLGEISGAILTKANAADVYTKSDIDNKLSVLESQVNDSINNSIETIVGAAPENFDTLKEISDVMNDLKVIDVPAQDATYWQEGDELPEGVNVGDVKTAAVEEVSHNMTIKEFVENSMAAVNEKPQIDTLQSKYNALLTLLNLRDTDVNNVIVNQKLTESNNVTFSDGTVDSITVPETSKSTTVTTELDTNSTLNLTSPKSITINNTSTKPTNLTVNAPVEGITPSVTLKSGVYDTITLKDASLNVSDNATVQNVVIAPETTKSPIINAKFVDGATVTSNSVAPITVKNKNAEGEEVSITLNAPGSTVTLSGGQWTTISGEVSENTLIINGNARIQSINLTKGNVIVEVPRSEDIATVISGEINLGEGYSITHRTYEITNENSSKLGGVGEMILQEDLTRTSSVVAPLAPAYNAVWNLNNHNITVTGTPKSGVYLNRYSSNLEVKGTGVIHIENSYGLWNSTTSGKIVVNDGVTIEAQTHVLYAEKGVIEVNGGSFKLTNANTAEKDAKGNFKFLLNCYDANYKAGTANIIVKGGKFYGFNPAESYGESDLPVSFVAEGYESIATNESYEYGTVYEVRKIQNNAIY